MALIREFILLLARDGVFLRDELAGHTHVKVFISVPQTVVHHRVHHDSVADAVAGTRLRQKIRTVGHGFHAAGDNDFAFAEYDGLGRECHGFQP